MARLPLQILINVLPLAVAALLAVRGWRQGLVAVGAAFAGLAGGLLLAGVSYQPVGRALAGHLAVPESAANILAYLGLVVAGQIVIIVVLRLLARRLPQGWHKSKVNGIGGAVAGAVQALVLAAVVFGIAATLPDNQQTRHDILSGPVSGPLAGLGRNLQTLAVLTPADDITRTINLLTVDPESTKSIDLGFTASGTVDQAAEAQMLVLVNRERHNAGLNPLRINSQAQEVARAHSRDMLARGYFSHNTPEGVDPFERMHAGNVRFGAAGENIALAPTLNLAHTGLMNSPPHKANILNRSYHAVGIGIIDAGPYGLMVTQDFTD